MDGDFTFIDLVAASTNALNGALLARRPDHYRNFTIVGILLMALLGGIGGGVTRDVLVSEVPAALTNPAYITLCLTAGVIGYLIAFASGQLFREGLFQFMTAFSLPWYAIVGAQKGVEVGLPILGALLLAVVGPTAGRCYIDIACGVTPKQLVRGEWFVAVASSRASCGCSSIGPAQHLGRRALPSRSALRSGSLPCTGGGRPLARGAGRGYLHIRRQAAPRPQAQGQVRPRVPRPRAIAGRRRPCRCHGHAPLTLAFLGLWEDANVITATKEWVKV